jgi:hypothetical protein
MQLKNKIVKLYNLTKEHFLMPFCLSIFITSVVILFFRLKLFPINNVIILYTGLTFGFIGFLLWVNKLSDKNLIKTLTKEIIMPFLLTTLIIGSTSELLHFNLNQFDLVSIITAALACSLLIFKLQNKNNKLFTELKIFRFKKMIYTIGIILIIILSFVLRINKLNDSFGMNLNSEKYVSYVPTAQNIYSTKNPFIFKNQAYTELDSNFNKYESKKYYELPIFYWYLSIFFPLTHYFSLEVTIHFSMLVLGGILLISIGNFLKKITNEWFALLGTLLFSLTPIYTLLAWITTMDTLSLIFFFISINLFLKEKREWAFIICTLSILNKLSFGIISCAFFLPLLIWNKEYRAITQLIGSIIFSFIAFQVFISPIAAAPYSFLRNIILLTLFILSYLIIFNLQKKLHNLKFKLNIRKFFIYFIPILVVILSFLFLWRNNFLNIISNFITNGSLIFNFPLYKLLWDRILKVNSPNLNYLLLIPLGCYLIFFKRMRVLTCFFISCLSYLVVASISIRYAWYYNHIFVLLIIMLIIFYLYKIKSYIKGSAMQIMFICLVAAIILTSIFSFPASHTFLFRNHPALKDINKLATFINQNTNNNNKILITQTEYGTTYMYAPRPYIFITGIRNSPENMYLDRIRNEIKSKGFFPTMDENGIKYLVTSIYDNDFESLTYLFTPNIDTNNATREHTILVSLNQENNYSTEVHLAYLKYNPKQYFKLVKKIGTTLIYELVNPTPPEFKS